MLNYFKQRLRKECSRNNSGSLLCHNKITALKDNLYFVENIPLDGDAPKQFIRIYQYIQRGNITRRNPKTWTPYIAKTAEKWYPHESVIEFMINRIGQELGLDMNDVCLLKINGQIRFLSKYFLNKNDMLIHGAEICGEYLDDMDLAKQIANEKNTSRELFTFGFIKQAIEAKFGNESGPLLLKLIEMITFDALVGNNDRHFYNWGVITTKKKTMMAPRFAPIYDSARGLLWNLSDINVINQYNSLNNGGKRISRYIDDACPRISIDGNSEVNHFGLIKYLKNYSSEYNVVINEIASMRNEEKVLELLNKEFYIFFIKERCNLITHIVQERFKKVREV